MHSTYTLHNTHVLQLWNGHVLLIVTHQIRRADRTMYVLNLLWLYVSGIQELQLNRSKNSAIRKIDSWQEGTHDAYHVLSEVNITCVIINLTQAGNSPWNCSNGLRLLRQHNAPWAHFKVTDTTILILHTFRIINFPTSKIKHKQGWM